MIARLYWLSLGAVLYGYAGYPAILALVTSRRPSHHWEPSPEREVTLLVPRTTKKPRSPPNSRMRYRSTTRRANFKS